MLEEEALAYEVHLKLTPEQFAEKKARQEEIQHLKASLDAGEIDDAEAVKVSSPASQAVAMVCLNLHSHVDKLGNMADIITLTRG